MAASITGIWNQLGLVHAKDSAHTARAADATSGSGNSSAAGNSANISANDFLTLLVTEMQNQDPTADTDPNEYINQLVQVNSLEQLISINQTLTEDSTAASSGSGTKKDVVASTANVTGLAVPPSAAPARQATSSLSGNLSIPAVNPAALQVAQAFGPVVNR